MYFTEPQRTQFDLNFSVLGIPVRVSPWFWLGSAIFGFGLTQGDPRKLFLWEIAVFISILVHEMGHAVMIRHYGEWPRVVLVFLGGLAMGGGTRSSREQVIISAAGPFFQIALAALTIAFVRAAGYQFSWQIPFWNKNWFDLNGIDQPQIPFAGLNDFVFYLVLPSILWAMINLVPVFPLDGGQIARSLFHIFDPRGGVRKSLVLGIVAGGAVALYAFQTGQAYLGILFAMLAFDSFQTYQGSGRWR
jgi:Zn-dependent protease